MMDAENAEFERMAREMIERHGARAARVATERLNEMIDRDNPRGREIWACIVHLIHQKQGTGPISDDWHDAVLRPAKPHVASFRVG